MTTHIQSRGFHLTRPLEEYVHRRLEAAVGGSRESVRKLWVRLSDINGPRGGADKRCRMRISVSHMPDVFVEDTQPDMYEAIDNAARKARKSLRRKLAKPRARQLRGRQRRGVLSGASPDVSAMAGTESTE